MRILPVLSALYLTILAGPTTAKESPFTHELLDQVLQDHVDTNGLVDYAGLKASSANLDAYLANLAKCSPDNCAEHFATPQDKLAYWINAYNAFVLKGVIAAYPVGSVAEIGGLDGFFRKARYTIGGQELTLDDIENQIIRPRYKDPRIHFVVNCGAISCPSLENKAFSGADLEAAWNDRTLTLILA